MRGNGSLVIRSKRAQVIRGCFKPLDEGGRLALRSGMWRLCQSGSRSGGGVGAVRAEARAGQADVRTAQPYIRLEQADVWLAQADVCTAQAEVRLRQAGVYLRRRGVLLQLTGVPLGRAKERSIV